MLYPYLTLESWFSLYFSLFIPFLLATWQKLIAQHIAPKTCHETKRLWVTAWFVQDVIWNILLTSKKKRYGAYTSASWLWNWLIVNASDFKMVWLIRIIQIQFTFIIALPVVNKTLFSFHSFFFPFYISISFVCHFYFLLNYSCYIITLSHVFYV